MNLKQIGRDFADDPTVQGSLVLPLTGVSLGWIAGDFVQGHGTGTHVIVLFVMLFAAATIYRLMDRYERERNDRIVSQRNLLRAVNDLDKLEGND